MGTIFSDKEKEAIRIGFGNILREKRKGSKKSQEKLADEAGLHRTYVGSVERGERNLSLENICVFAKILGCHPRDLIPDLPMEKGKGLK